MSNFYQTLMEQNFFEGQVPKIINSLDEVASEIKHSNRLKEKELELKERELEMKHQELIAKRSLSS